VHLRRDERGFVEVDDLQADFTRPACSRWAT
jgi:hypothetical protein